VTAAQWVVFVCAQVALVTTAAGLVVRKRWRLSWAFGAYVVTVLSFELALALSPRRFFASGFWMAKQVVYDGAKLALAVELAWRVFRVFPGARATARWLVLGILSVTMASLTTALIDASGSDLFLIASGQLHPLVLNGTIWVIAATLALARWYHVPVHPFHSALLASFATYMTLFGALLRLEGLYGWAAQRYLNALDPAAYLLLTCWWCYVGWRRDGVDAADYDDTLQKLELRTA
jgi:hypothetical protein